MSESVLRNAYELIRDPDRWCTHAMARDNLGQSVAARDPDAVRWCAFGALGKCGKTKWTSTIRDCEVVDRIVAELYGSSHSITSVNDNLGHAATVAVFEKALASTEGGL